MKTSLSCEIDSLTAFSIRTQMQSYPRRQTRLMRQMSQGIFKQFESIRKVGSNANSVITYQQDKGSCSLKHTPNRQGLFAEEEAEQYETMEFEDHQQNCSRRTQTHSACGSGLSTEEILCEVLRRLRRNVQECPRRRIDWIYTRENTKSQTI